MQTWLNKALFFKEQLMSPPKNSIERLNEKDCSIKQIKTDI